MVCPVAVHRVETLPGWCAWSAPCVLTMSLLPLLVVLNQLALSTADGHWIWVSARVARTTTVCLRHLLPIHVVERTQTELLPFLSYA